MVVWKFFHLPDFEIEWNFKIELQFIMKIAEPLLQETTMWVGITACLGDNGKTKEKIIIGIKGFLSTNSL